MTSKAQALADAAARIAKQQGIVVFCDQHGRVPDIDSVTWGLAIMDYFHHKTHEGDAYMLKEGFALNNASKEYLITVPDSTTRFHSTIVVEGSMDTSYVFKEGTGKTGGTPITMNNLERASTNTIQSGFTLTHTPTGTEGSATQLFSGQFGMPILAGGRGGTGGDSGSGRVEWPLKPGEKYSLLVTALSANANNITVIIAGYETIHKG